MLKELEGVAQVLAEWHEALSRPKPFHQYTKGIHDSPCPACELRQSLEWCLKTITETR